MKKLRVLFIGLLISLFVFGGIGCAGKKGSDSNATESNSSVESSFASDETETSESDISGGSSQESDNSESDISGGSSQESDSSTSEDNSTTESTSSQESDEWLDIIFPRS